MKLDEPARHREDSCRWIDGTQLLAVVLERFAGGGPVKITRDDVLRAEYGCTHPVIFTIEPGGETVTLTVGRPEN